MVNQLPIGREATKIESIERNKTSIPLIKVEF